MVSPVDLLHDFGRPEHILVGVGPGQRLRGRPDGRNLFGQWAIAVGGVCVDQAEEGVQVADRVDRKLREVSGGVVLIGDVDGGDTGIGRLGAVERRPRQDPGQIQTHKPLCKAAIRSVRVTEHQESDVRWQPSGLDEREFLVDHDRRALGIAFNEVGLAGILQLLLRHCDLQVRHTVWN